MDSYTRALSAYQQTLARGLEGDSASVNDAAAAGGPSFAEVLQTASEGAVAQMHKAETVSAQALVGRADLTDVVTAISQAELTLQGIVSMRDRVVSAYQEVLRMQM